MTPRGLPVVTIVLAAIVALSACAPLPPTPQATVDTTTPGPASGPGPPAPPIVIGLNAESSGGLDGVGRACVNAAQMAVDEVNQAGGLIVGERPYPVKLVVEDNGNDARRAAVVTYRLITRDDVLAIIGPNTTQNALAAAATAEEARVPLITPWATNPLVTRGRKYVFRAAFVDTEQGRAMALFAWNELAADTAVIIHEGENEYTGPIAEAFEKTFKGLDGKVVANLTYKADSGLTADVISDTLKADPQVIFLPTRYNEAPTQIRRLRAAGLKVPIVGIDLWGSPELIRLGGNDVEGLFFSAHYAPDVNTPQAQHFAREYQARYDTPPDDVAALTYDAFGLLFRAIKEAGRFNRDSVREALANLTGFEGVTGRIVFQNSGDPLKDVMIRKVQGGKFVYHTSLIPPAPPEEK